MKKKNGYTAFTGAMAFALPVMSLVSPLAVGAKEQDMVTAAPMAAVASQTPQIFDVVDVVEDEKEREMYELSMRMVSIENDELGEDIKGTADVTISTEDGGQMVFHANQDSVLLAPGDSTGWLTLSTATAQADDDADSDLLCLGAYYEYENGASRFVALDDFDVESNLRVEQNMSVTFVFGKDGQTINPDVFGTKTSFLVSFETFEGEALDSQRVKAGSEAMLPTPVREGYAFTGWYIDEACEGDVLNSLTPTSDVTIYAGWEKLEVAPEMATVIFDSWGGNEIPNMQYAIGETVVLPVPVRDGYTFKGWHTGSDMTPFTELHIDGSIQLQAVWVENVYAATFYAGNHTTVTGFHKGDKVVFPEVAERPGYTFKCWTLKDGTEVKEYEMSGEDVVFYAAFVADTFETTFEMNAPFEIPDDVASNIIVETVRGDEVDFPDITILPEGYKFLGWFAEKEGGEALEEFAVYEDSTVYAQWTKVEVEDTDKEDDTDVDTDVDTDTETDAEDKDEVTPPETTKPEQSESNTNKPESEQVAKPQSKFAANVTSVGGKVMEFKSGALTGDKTIQYMMDLFVGNSMIRDVTEIPSTKEWTYTIKIAGNKNETRITSASTIDDVLNVMKKYKSQVQIIARDKAGNVMGSAVVTANPSYNTINVQLYDKTKTADVHLNPIGATADAPNKVPVSSAGKDEQSEGVQTSDSGLFTTACASMLSMTALMGTLVVLRKRKED